MGSISNVNTPTPGTQLCNHVGSVLCLFAEMDSAPYGVRHTMLGARNSAQHGNWSDQSPPGTACLAVSDFVQSLYAFKYARSVHGRFIERKFSFVLQNLSLIASTFEPKSALLAEMSDQITAREIQTWIACVNEGDFKTLAEDMASRSQSCDCCHTYARLLYDTVWVIDPVIHSVEPVAPVPVAAAAAAAEDSTDENMAKSIQRLDVSGSELPAPGPSPVQSPVLPDVTHLGLLCATPVTSPDPMMAKLVVMRHRLYPIATIGSIFGGAPYLALALIQLGALPAPPAVSPTLRKNWETEFSDPANKNRTPFWDETEPQSAIRLRDLEKVSSRFISPKRKHPNLETCGWFATFISQQYFTDAASICSTGKRLVKALRARELTAQPTAAPSEPSPRRETVSTAEKFNRQLEHVYDMSAIEEILASNFNIALDGECQKLTRSLDPLGGNQLVSIPI